jgi:DNA-binding HxlR family transcriptional regulator
MRKRQMARRSDCPLNASLEMVGDRWSLLIVRDMMLRGASTFAEFLGGYEHIATNILTDRLRGLTQAGIIETTPHPDDGRKKVYRLTKKGIDLAPVLTEMVLWASAHETTGNRALVRQMQNKNKFLAGVRARWHQSR